MCTFVQECTWSVEENQSRGNNGKQVALKASDAIVIYCLGPDVLNFVFNLSSYKLG